MQRFPSKKVQYSLMQLPNASLIHSKKFTKLAFLKFF